MELDHTTPHEVSIDEIMTDEEIKKMNAGYIKAQTDFLNWLNSLQAQRCQSDS